MKNSSFKNLDSAELEKSKLVIGQFITSCSHTMRGPLKSISGLVNLLQSNSNYSQQEVDMFLNLISSTVEKMERTLDELEHFLENSKRAVLIKPVDCRELVSLTLHQYREELNSGQIELELNITQPELFYSDVARFRVILSNLISNAIQFQDANKQDHKITLELHATSKECIVTLKDNGIGIHPEHHSKIFQLFYRASEQSTGTGVGLYVVQEAVKKMKGSIQVDSQPGIGSTFLITLPNFKSQ
jgi:signal transduction histidine kinase